MLTAAIGCSSHYDWDPSDVTVVRTVAAPAGGRSALLVRHVSRFALNNDVYRVVIAESRLEASPEAVVQLPDSAIVLDATHAARVELRWVADTVLELKCADCGLERIDIVKRQTHWGPVRIVYTGFPSGTAYSAQ